jgi:hypothetical protein
MRIMFISILIYFSILQTTSAATKQNDIDTYDLLNKTHLNVEFKDLWLNGMFGNNDYWQIRIQGEETVFVWDGIRQLPFGDLAYQGWFGADSLKMLESAAVEGTVGGVERYLGIGIVKDSKGVAQAIKKLNKYRKKYKASKDAIRDTIGFIMSNESTTETTLKVLTYAFASPYDKEMNGRKIKIISQPDDYYLVYDKRDEGVVMTTHNADLQNPLVARIKDSLKIYNGATLVSFSGASAPEMKTDNGVKEGRRTQQTLQNLTYDIYQILSGKEAVYFKNYADTLVNHYFSDMTTYLEEKDQALNNQIAEIDKAISELEKWEDKEPPKEELVENSIDLEQNKEIVKNTDQTKKMDEDSGNSKDIILISIGEYEVKIEKGFLQQIIDWIEKILKMLKDIV